MAEQAGIPLNHLPRGLSVVIPVYNSQESLPFLIERLKPVLDAVGLPYELILVNDGSTDRSWEIVSELTREHPWIRGFCLLRNFGQHNALLCGIRQARFSHCLTMDDDLQNPPEEIPKLLEKMEEGFDLVYGTPETPRHGLFRLILSAGSKILFEYALGAKDLRRASPFRIFRTCLREVFSHFTGVFVSIDILLSWGIRKKSFVLVRHDRRKTGRSGYNLKKQFAHAVNIATTFSVRPLQLASFIGFLFTLFGVAVLVWTVGRYILNGGSVPGFPFLASIIGIFSGAQLFCLGIIGEYLARMHFRLLDRPSYVIFQLTGTDSENGNRNSS